MELLLETIHGSHLYGLNHQNSDTDVFKVIKDNPTMKGTYSKHTINTVDGDVVDETITDLSTFVLYAGKGVPQYLEAMWSNKTTFDGMTDFRYGFRPDYYNTQAVYLRTIRNFYDAPDLKRKRHAYRLTLSLLDFREKGIFNPTLDKDELELLQEMLLDDPGPDYYLEA